MLRGVRLLSGLRGFCTEACIVQPIPGKGRGLVATRNLSCGEEVLMEHPIAWVSRDPSMWGADMERSGLPKDGSDALVRFCGENSLKFPLLVAQLVMTSMRPGTPGGFSGFWQNIGQLCYAKVENQPPQWAESHALLRASFSPLGAAPLFDGALDQAWLSHILAILHLNCMQLQTNTAVTALFQRASLFNHQCRGNVDIFTDVSPGAEGEWVASFRVNREVQKDEELCIEYDRPLEGEDREEFLKRLEFNYGFRCVELPTVWCPLCQ